MGWLTYRISGSVWLLGSSPSAAAPASCAGDVRRVVADHVRRRNALRITQSLGLFQAVVLAVDVVRSDRGRHLVVLAPLASVPCLRRAAAPDVAGAPSRIVRPHERDRVNLFLVVLRVGVWAGGRRAAPAVVSEAVASRRRAVVVAVIIVIRLHAVEARARTRAGKGGFWVKWVEGHRSLRLRAATRDAAHRRDTVVDHQPVPARRRRSRKEHRTARRPRRRHLAAGAAHSLHARPLAGTTMIPWDWRCHRQRLIGSGSRA